MFVCQTSIDCIHVERYVAKTRSMTRATNTT